MKQKTIDTICFTIKAILQALFVLFILFQLLFIAEVFQSYFIKQQVKEDYKYSIKWPDGEIWPFQSWDKDTKWRISK